MKGLKVDLVIWNEDFAGYRQVLQEQIMGLISSTHLANQLNEPGGIFVRLAEQISPEDRILISSVARIIISDMDGPLALQIKRSERKERRKLLPLHTTRPYVPLPEATRLVFNNKLLNNGIGGYSRKWRGIHHSPSGKGLDTRPLGQRSGKRHIRNHRQRKRAVLHLGYQRTRIPAHPVGK